MPTSDAGTERAVSILLFAASLIFPVVPSAAGDAGIVINEVLLFPGFTGAELLPYEFQWLELYNSGTSDVDLTGMTLADREGTPLATLPPWTLPAGAYLTVRWQEGTDDPDFGDGDGHYYLGDVDPPFSADEDEAALYVGPPSADTIVDFVAWSEGSPLPGAAQGHAIAAGIWTAGQFVDTGEVFVANTLGRGFNGWDTDGPGDWIVYRWNPYILAGFTQPANPIHLAPLKNDVLLDGLVAFDWQDLPTVSSYQLQVDNDPDFSSPVIDVNVASSQHTPVKALSFGGYFYRVRGIFSGTPTHWSAAWLFAVDDTGSLANRDTTGGGVTCPFRFQRKDTRLLCIWDDAQAERPGCAEFANHRWDVPHPNQAPPGNEPHCDNNCARASIAMINARYGGDLSQDRISYHYFHEIASRVAGPEGDLGHGSWMVGQDFVNTISWALNGAAITVDPAPAGGFTFQQMRNWFNTHGCFVTNLPGHVVVTNGFIEVDAFGIVIRIILIHDPALGANQYKVYEWDVFGNPQPPGIAANITFVLRQPAPPAVINGRMQEVSVGMDRDSDGVMDFDEQMPRTFHSDANERDTDLDEVPDKNDIRNYTFHDSYHAHENDALTFSDFDRDGLRSENDCDSDGPDALGGDGDFDGGEDIDGDGHNPLGGETCMFNSGDWLLDVSTDKSVYRIGEPVYVVDIHRTRETHTYHRTSLYPWELGNDCPDKVNDTPLAHHGAFQTDGGGHAIPALVEHCPGPPGRERYLTVDVLRDRNYSEPDNTDPQTCWRCVRRIWDCVFSPFSGTTLFSASTWTRDGAPVGETFPDGVTPVEPIPGYTWTDLPVDPNDWHWDVTLPGCGGITLPIRLDVQIVNIPPETEVHVPVVCSTRFPSILLSVDIAADRYVIVDDDGLDVAQGPWSAFPGDLPPQLGFAATGISRQNFIACDGEPNPEIGGLRAIDPETIVWVGTPGATPDVVYDVVRGAVTELPVGSGPSEACVGPGREEPSARDSGVPEPGSAFWYLVRARNDCGGDGTYGSRSDGLQRTTFACQSACRQEGDACPPGTTCCSGLCLDGICACVPDGDTCDDPTNCCSGACLDGTCVACLPDDELCNDSTSCCNGSCLDGVCRICLPDGNSCDDPTQCCSDLCLDGVCRVCLPDGDSCNDPSQCCNASCLNGVCQTCLPNNQPCNDPTQCCNGSCLNGACRICLPEGDACDDPTTCCNGSCLDGVCRTCLPDGDFCDDPTLCCSGSCLEGVCGACLPDGKPCDDPTSCCGGSCFDGICQPEPTD